MGALLSICSFGNLDEFIVQSNLHFPIKAEFVGIILLEVSSKDTASLIFCFCTESVTKVLVPLFVISAHRDKRDFFSGKSAGVGNDSSIDFEEFEPSANAISSFKESIKVARFLLQSMVDFRYREPYEPAQNDSVGSTCQNATKQNIGAKTERYLFIVFFSQDKSNVQFFAK